MFYAKAKVTFISGIVLIQGVGERYFYLCICADIVYTILQKINIFNSRSTYTFFVYAFVK